MNGRKIKELKRVVYGDFSSKEKNYTRGLDGSVRSVGRRAAYQRLKREGRQQSGGNKPIRKGKRRPRWLFPEKRDQ